METTQVIHKKLTRDCRFGNCKTRATFFNEATPKEVFCKEHKTPNMINNQIKCCALNCET